MSKLKNGTQRVLAALLSLCMLLAVLPGAALAEAGEGLPATITIIQNRRSKARNKNFCADLTPEN